MIDFKREFSVMIQKHIKLSIGFVSAVIIAVYTYFLYLYGGEYISYSEYVIHSATTILCLIFVLLIQISAKSATNGKSVVLYTIISISGLLTILHFSEKTFRYNAQMLTTGIWPIICGGIAKYINSEKSTRTPVADFALFNVVIILLIWFLEEKALKYNHISSDITAEIYMYITALYTFMIYSTHYRKTQIKRYEIICIISLVAVVALLCLYNHDRIYEIVRSFHTDKTYIDTDGLNSNWIIHRISMLSASFTGDFSKFNKHILPLVAQGCSVIHISSVGGRYIFVIILMLNIAMTFLLITNSQKNHNPLIKTITMSFITKILFGLVANMFLIYSTTVGLPFIQTSYDIIPLAYILFDSGKYKNTDSMQ